MANQLKMAKLHSILTLHERGWSNREIAQALGIHRETVNRHVRLAEQEASGLSGGSSKPAKVPTGSGGQSRSGCRVFREVIEGKLEQGLSAQRIWQDLVAEHGFEGGYDSVKRFVSKLGQVSQLPFRRMESAPGHTFRPAGRRSVGAALPHAAPTLGARRGSVRWDTGKRPAN